MNRLQQLRRAGVSIWLDTLSRDLIESGKLGRYIRYYGVTGATSNPSIFERALAGSHHYDTQLRALSARGIDDPRRAFFELALEDIRQAAYLFDPAHRRNHGRDGFVSFEVTPDVADDTQATVAQALEVSERLGCPHLMIKVPATDAGVPAIEELTARGVSVNVTLLFAVDRYEQVMEAYLRGLERRADEGLALAPVASVASFFVSRVDAKAEAVLTPGSPLRGGVAVANAHLAYARHVERFAGARWEQLVRLGARPQRPLWASTGTKNREYSDVLYVEDLVAPGTVNTMPEHTLRAFAEHGQVGESIPRDSGPAERTLAEAADAGLDLAAITAELEREGVEAFIRSYANVLGSLEKKLPRLAAVA
jgi:transaldolase